jgi:hypothetical protein
VKRSCQQALISYDLGKNYGESGNLITKRRKKGDAFGAFPTAQAHQREARATSQRQQIVD